MLSRDTLEPKSSAMQKRLHGGLRRAWDRCSDGVAVFPKYESARTQLRNGTNSKPLTQAMAAGGGSGDAHDSWS